jgi:hypothetical protein
MQYIKPVYNLQNQLLLRIIKDEKLQNYPTGISPGNGSYPGGQRYCPELLWLEGK